MKKVLLILTVITTTFLACKKEVPEPTPTPMVIPEPFRTDFKGDTLGQLLHNCHVTKQNGYALAHFGTEIFVAAGFIDSTGKKVDISVLCPMKSDTDVWTGIRHYFVTPPSDTFFTVRWSRDTVQSIDPKVRMGWVY